MFDSLGVWFRRQSVARKLTSTALATSGVALVASCVVFAAYDYLSSRARLVRDVTVVADIVGTYSNAALTFKDATAAAEGLRGTAVNQNVRSVQLFTLDGTQLATYTRPGVAPILLRSEDAAPGVEAAPAKDGGQSSSTTSSSAASSCCPIRRRSGPG